MANKTPVDKASWETAGNLFKPGITPEEVKAGYDDWSKNYDEMLMNTQYYAPAIAVGEIRRRIPEERRAEIRVLDVAAGTGWVGRELYKEGYRHIDAVEPSEGMMDKLKQFGVYSNTYLEPIGTGHSTVPDDSYDLVVISGGMGEGHIPISGMDDLVRVGKKGAIVIIVMRHEFVETVEAYKDKLEPYMEKLEKEGKWKKVERRVVPNYFFEKEGVVYVFCVT